MNIEQIRAIKAVDVHSHFGEWNVPYNSADGNQKYSAFGVDSLLRDMQLSNIGISINSHLKALMPRGGADAIAGNELCIKEAENNENIYMWVVINPWQKESYAQAEQLLKHPKCLGIKLHPEEHLYHILKFGHEIYDFAAKHGAIIKTHSGEANSLPEDFAILANHYPVVKTIVAHLGCGYDGCFEHQIRGIKRCIHDNMYTDTSSAKSLYPNLIENAVTEVGSEKLLFGSDHGCYFSPCLRIRIDYAHIGVEDKLNILYRNAVRLFPQIKDVVGNK